MCTVSYVPQSNGNFTLTFNRDESPQRSGGQLEKIKVNGQSIIYPKDIGAGGSWLAVNLSTGGGVCLLNGAFHLHKRQPPYRMSRGKMVIEYFGYKNASDFRDRFDFKEMEPFTLIIYGAGALQEIRWDGKTLFEKKLDHQQYYLWSSATLYTPAIMQLRERAFSRWLENHREPSAEAILAFHQSTHEEQQANGFLIDRKNLVKTISVTQVHQTSQAIQLTYLDRTNDIIEKQVNFMSRQIL